MQVFMVLHALSLILVSVKIKKMKVRFQRNQWHKTLVHVFNHELAQGCFWAAYKHHGTERDTD